MLFYSFVKDNQPLIWHYHWTIKDFITVDLFVLGTNIKDEDSNI